MTYPLVRFVAAPDEGATVRFDFNESNVSYVGAADFDLGVPSFEGDPDGIGVEYGTRALSFNVYVRESKSVALAKQSALARELLRQENWLLFQLSAASEPVWFKTYRSQPGGMSLEWVYSDLLSQDAWQITVPLVAAPFAYGALETVGPVTINNDPAHATNPMSYVLPAIKGDAPAPLRVDVTPSASTVWFKTGLFMVGQAPTVLQTTTATALTDTGAEVAIAGFSGGAGRKITFATAATLQIRLSWSVTVTPGRYKVLARAARSDTTTTYSMVAQALVLGSSVSGPITPMSRVASPASGHTTWLDLGELSLPPFLPGEGASVTPVTSTLQLMVGRDSGAGEVWVDALMLVPVDSVSTLKSANLYRASGAPAAWRWDGDSEWFHGVDGSGNSAAFVNALMRGSFPRVDPGATGQRFLFWQTVDYNSGASLPNDDSDVLAESATVTLSYHPRFLWLGDS